MYGINMGNHVIGIHISRENAGMICICDGMKPTTMDITRMLGHPLIIACAFFPCCSSHDSSCRVFHWVEANWISYPHCQSARYPATNDKFFAGERRYSHTKRLVRINLYPCKIDLVQWICISHVAMGRTSATLLWKLLKKRPGDLGRFLIDFPDGFPICLMVETFLNDGEIHGFSPH